MENEKLQIASLPLAKISTEKIEIMTNINKKDSYTVAVSLCIPESERNAFAGKMQNIYDTHHLNLTYIDEGKFWQVPHVTLVIFEKVRLENIEKFQGIFALLNALSVQFTPSTCEFFGKGDWLVVKPHSNIAKNIKGLNERVIDWVQENITPQTYKIQSNTAKNIIKPHMAINTTVPTMNWGSKHYITKIISQELKSMTISLQNIVITATNEWS